MKKRQKQYFNYILQQWKQHKPICYGFTQMREEDWYRLTEIVKRGESNWFKEKNHGK